MNELRDAARKTGRWLHFFHHHIHTPVEKVYSVRDILKEVQSYGERLESSSSGRIRSQIVAGYFDEKPADEMLARIYSAIKVMDTWLMYEELMSRYKGIKHLLSVPVGPFVTRYFQYLLKKHLGFINNDMQYQASGTLLTKSS